MGVVILMKPYPAPLFKLFVLYLVQRDISKASFHEEPTRNYLVLLGIRQTCRYQNKSFFRFLFSEETDLDNFKPRKSRQNKN
jgi:hypothetical protein